MGVILNFDASQVAPATGIADPLPAGWYNVAITESEMKPTKDAGGFYLQLTMEVLDGQYAKRKLFPRLNLRNANPVAQEIAYKDLSAICHSVGILQVADSAQLHNRPLKVKVKLRPAEGQYEASNEVSAYRNINEQVEMAKPAAAPAGAPAAAHPGFPAPAATPAAPAATPAAPAGVAQGGGWTPPAAAQPWAGAPAQVQAGAPAPGVAPAWAAPGAPAPTAAPAMPAAPAPSAASGFVPPAPPWATPAA